MAIRGYKGDPRGLPGERETERESFKAHGTAGARFSAYLLRLPCRNFMRLRILKEMELGRKN